MRDSGYPPDPGWTHYMDIASLVAICSNHHQTRPQPCGWWMSHMGVLLSRPLLCLVSVDVMRSGYPLPFLGYMMENIFQNVRPQSLVSCYCANSFFFFFFFLRFYLFSEGGREKEGERNVHWLPLLHAPNWGPVLQPRHVPLLGFKPVALQFSVQDLMH